MWFQVLGLIIALALLLKASVALAIPGRFYAARQQQYASESIPRKLLFAPPVILLLTASAWYATVFHYRPWGFVVTATFSALLLFSVINFFRWKSHSRRMYEVISRPSVWRIDAALLALGFAFLALAIFVY